MAIPNHVPVAPSPAEYPVTGTANYGPTAASTSFEFMTKGHVYRIRQTGDVRSFTIYVGSTTNVTGIKFRVWRENGGVYDLVGESESFSSISANALNRFDLATPFTAQRGDYVGVRMTYSSSTGSNFIKTAALQANTTFGATAVDTVDEDVFTYYVEDATPTTGFDWEAESALTNETVRVRTNMKAPDVVFLGDSITSGRFATYSFADDAQAVYSASASYPARVAALQTSFSWQTIARSGRTTADLDSEFMTYVAPLLPKYVVIMAGVNDINTSVPNATIITRMTSILDKAINLGMYPIVMGVLPEAPHGGSNTLYQNIDSLNASLETLVEGSPYNGTFIDTTGMGQFYAPGDPGNLWQLITGYATATDDVHLSTTGQSALGDIVDAAFTFVARSEAHSGSATGGTITTDGDYTVHTFNNDGTFTVTGTLIAELMAVGGGAGGGCYWGGGGGAGQLLHRDLNLSAAGYAVVVGAGGTAGDPLGTNSGGNGGTSSFDTTDAEGGGGGRYNGVGLDGACGGGGGSTGAAGPLGGVASVGGDGGAAQNSGFGYPGGGGGGMAENGDTAASAQGGNGGDGLELAISGASIFYCGGGAGGVRTGTGGTGGRGGGGSAGNGGAGFTPGGDGTDGLGGGGAGGSGEAADDAQTGGAGGKGVVVIRYLTYVPPSGTINNYTNFYARLRRVA